MNPEKEPLTCDNCNAEVPNDSKHRGRFNRRHQRDNVCGNYFQKQEAIRTAAEINAAAVKSVEGNDDTRVNMSGDGGVDTQVDGGTLQGGAQ